MLFPDAADSWLRSRVGISENTKHDHYRNIKRLSKCFGEMRLAEIQFSHIQAYQTRRAAGTIPGLRKAGPLAINHELSTLKRVLDCAGEWDRLKKLYQPLRIARSRVGRELSKEEENYLFNVAYKDTELARKLAACVVSHVSGTESIDCFLQHHVPEEVPPVWHQLAEQVMRALLLGSITTSRDVSKLIQ
jgi:hypothetical protein